MKEISQEVRTVLAIVLSVVVIGIWSYFFRPKPPAVLPGSTVAQKSSATSPPGPTPSPAGRERTAAGETAGATGAKGVSAAATAAAPRPRAASTEQTLVVESGLYRVELSNQGGSVRSWQLAKFREESGKPLDVVHAAVARVTGRWPLMLALDDAQQEAAVNGALYQMTPAEGVVRAPASVELAWSDGHLAVSKRLKFAEDYIVSIETLVTLDGKPVPHAVAWRGGFGDATAFAAADQVRVVYSRGGSLSDIAAKKAGDSKNPEKPVSIGGEADFGGIVDHYFAAAFLPGDGKGMSLEHWKFDREIEVEGKKDTEAVAEVAASEPAANPMRLRLFVGPKAVDVLERVRPPLTDLVTFGYLAIVARPLFDFLIWIHRYVPNYGWAIVVMTVLINMVLFPLKYRSFHQMLKMQRVMPEIKQIQDRYKKYSMRDPRKQEMNQEVMAVYNREGVNPIGGCLPTVIQMPIWFALYRMLDVAIELRQAPWQMWVHDLSARDPYYILPILMCVTMYFMQKMTPVTTADPAQQRMMNYMPLFMGFLFLRLASGLVLYILTSNIVATGQQWFLYRTMKEAKDAGGKKSAPEKKAKPG
ncbi:MAG TPA: membrane protein insertase YidC [Candidatus Binatia bacterium]|nr:membrane protein insertase YidC [Candidatus Binatia bacterium]